MSEKYTMTSNVDGYPMIKRDEEIFFVFDGENINRATLVLNELNALQARAESAEAKNQRVRKKCNKEVSHAHNLYLASNFARDLLAILDTDTILSKFRDSYSMY